MLEHIKSDLQLENLYSPRREQVTDTAQIRQLWAETKVLELLCKTGCLEKLPRGAMRAGLESELSIVDAATFLPQTKNRDLVAKINNPDWVVELSAWQIESRTRVHDVASRSLSEMAKELHRGWMMANSNAEELGLKLIPTAILPTISESELVASNITQRPDNRYLKANAVASKARGGDFHLNIEGRDGPISIPGDSVISVAMGASLQPHLQCSAEDLVDMHNISVGIAGLVLGPCVGSPLVLGQCGPKESRISIFEDGAMPGRVFLADGYIHSAWEPFEENLRFEPVFKELIHSDLLSEAPSLPNLRQQNGLIHRWIRPVYDIYQGTPHVRIEFRPLGISPSATDNVANAAFYWGLAWGFKSLGVDMSGALSFNKAEENFYAAAKDGLDAIVTMPGKAQAQPLHSLKSELIDIARIGLDHLGIAQEEQEKYLGLIAKRFDTRTTEADWIVKHASQGSRVTSLETRSEIARRMHEAMVKDIPVTDR